MSKKVPTRRGPKTAASSEQLARFAHTYRRNSKKGVQPRKWESITKAANKRFGTSFLSAHVKRCYSKHREELTNQSIHKFFTAKPLGEILQERLAARDQKREVAHERLQAEPDWHIRRQALLEEEEKRLHATEAPVMILQKKLRKKYNRRFKKKRKKKGKTALEQTFGIMNCYEDPAAESIAPERVS